MNECVILYSNDQYCLKNQHVKDTNYCNVMSSFLS